MRSRRATKEKAGLEEFEPKVTSQRKFPREPSLLLPTHLKYLCVLAKKKFAADQQQNRHTAKSTHTTLKVQKNNNYRGI